MSIFANIKLKFKVYRQRSKLQEMCLSIKDFNLLRRFVHRTAFYNHHENLEHELLELNASIKWLETEMERIK